MTEGRVITRFGQTCMVQAANDDLLECRLRRSLGQVVCGDLVSFDPDDRVLTELHPRNSSFARADKRGRKQVIAANIDLIIIVVAPKPAPTRDLINRYLVACHNVGIEAAIFVNKSDLLDDDSKAEWQQRQALYQSLDYRCLCGGAKSGEGLEQLQQLIRGRICILVGQSGVGKSSLVNRLVPDLQLRTQQISDSTGKGRHTTTATTLYPLREELDQADELSDALTGAIIDSPGVWEYGIWQMDAAEVAAGFIEFGDYLGQCRFADCSHTVEPDCALAAAVSNGQIDPLRFASYQRIVSRAAD